MPAPTTRVFTATRIVALAIITVLLAGLAYLRIASGADAVSVPAGAHAGQLKMHPCSYATEAGSSKADCGTLVVPENRADPKSRLIALPVTRIRARNPHPAEPIFRLEGGPGKTNMEFAVASRYAVDHDVVLVGYRGVDGSARLDCPEVDAARRGSGDLLGAASLRASERALRACADRLRSDGFDLAGYSLPQRTDDLEDARRALGYERVNLLSESAGTRTAMIYSWRHPSAIHRSVMIAANPPGHYLWDPAQTDAQLRRLAALCAKSADCPAGADGDLVASIRKTAADVPDRWGVLPIKAGNARLGSFFGLMDASSKAAPISAPMTLETWRAAAKGDAGGLWFMSLLSELVFPTVQVWGDSAAVARTDAAAAKAHFASGARSALGDPGSEFLWAGGRLADAWPANPDEGEYATVRTSTVPTLLISGTVDGATPAVNATRELLPHLPNGQQVVLRDFGHTTDFWDVQPKAGTRLVNAFMDSGRVDDSRYVRQAIDFTPSRSHGGMAKVLASTMFALAIVTVLWLLWMARRVATRGRLGRKTRVLVRSAGPLVLGLGGWCAGALVALIAMPRVPIDSAWLVVAFVGTPVGLAIYCAWVDRRTDAATKAYGFAAAVAGALAGAALGFASTEGLLAPVAAIVGAGAVANLAVIVRDMTSAGAADRHRDVDPLVAGGREFGLGVAAHPLGDEREPAGSAAR